MPPVGTILEEGGEQGIGEGASPSVHLPRRQAPGLGTVAGRPPPSGHLVLPAGPIQARLPPGCQCQPQGRPQPWLPLTGAWEGGRQTSVLCRGRGDGGERDRTPTPEALRHSAPSTPHPAWQLWTPLPQQTKTPPKALNPPNSPRPPSAAKPTAPDPHMVLPKPWTPLKVLNLPPKPCPPLSTQTNSPRPHPPMVPPQAPQHPWTTTPSSLYPNQQPQTLLICHPRANLPLDTPEAAS